MVAAHSLPRFEKSADRMDGAIIAAGAMVENLIEQAGNKE